MPITNDVRKRGEKLVEQGKTTLADSSKPFYALVGANDLAVEKLRDQLTQLQTRGTKLQERIVALPQEYKALPETVKTLPTVVKTYADTWSGKATEVYGELTERGEKIVAQIRRKPAIKKPAAKKPAAKTTKASSTSTTKAAPKVPSIPPVEQAQLG